jgi:hypothetical protein
VVEVTVILPLIITSSLVPGTTPPIQLAVDDQLPVIVFEVIVPAYEKLHKLHNRTSVRLKERGLKFIGPIIIN